MQRGGEKLNKVGNAGRILEIYKQGGGLTKAQRERIK
jgi:hypothetical protein